MCCRKYYKYKFSWTELIVLEQANKLFWTQQQAERIKQQVELPWTAQTELPVWT